MEVTVLARDYNAGALPFPDALLRLPRLRALTLQIPCKVSLRLNFRLCSDAGLHLHDLLQTSK